MRRSRARHLTLLAAFSILILIEGVVLPVWAQVSTGDLFYFHDNSILYRNENSSVTVIAEANLEPPNASVSKATEVAANIRNATTPFGTIWVGSVSWLSQPLTKYEVLQGIVTITAWLSSDNSTPPFSGIGAGIGIVDDQNKLVGQSQYAYSYGQGSVLTTQVKSYEFNVTVNRSVQAGQRLVFAVGLGATRQGWKMEVYFDSLQYPSRVQLPGSVAVVSEPVTPLVVGSCVAVTILLSESRRGPPRKSRRST